MGAGSGNGGEVTVPVGLAAAVAMLIPALQQHIPPEPAAVLGRLGAHAPTSPLHQMPRHLEPPGERSGLRPRQHPSGRTLVAIRNGGGRGRPESAAMASLRGLDPFVTERLLGALELTVEDLRPTIPAGMIVALPQQRGLVAVAGTGSDGAVLRAVGRLDAIRPGLSDSVISLARALAGSGTGTDDGAGGVDHGDPADRDESSVAGRHGARFLALGVATAAVVMAAQDLPYVNGPTVIGAGIAAAAELLREAPMPAEYADAQLERRRADYLMPRSSVASVVVQDNEFALVEAATDVRPDFSRNGLVDVVPGGVMVRTGIEQGQSTCYLRVVADEPELEDGVWDEIVDVSWTAATGSATAAGLRDATPPWPGEYRTRVCADGRDRGQERYELTVWAAPAEPEVVHKVSDTVGRLLRGEDPGSDDVPPHERYRWVGTGVLSEAATVTVTVGSALDQVVRAFGADPAEPVSLAQRLQEFGIDPWVGVLEHDGAVLAVEVNGWQGSLAPVLRELSATGTAASMYWNVNAVTRLSFARHGQVLDSFEPGMSEKAEAAEVIPVVTGLGLDDYRDKVPKGLTAVERFTGHGITAELLDRIIAADIAFPILPRLPEQYVRERTADGSLRWPPSGPLASSTGVLLVTDDDRLRDLAWWIAEQTTVAAGLADHPAVQESLAARTLTAAAEQLTRRSELQGHSAHRQVWLTVYGATNPDPLSAVLDASEAAQYAIRPADELLAVIQERVAEL